MSSLWLLLALGLTFSAIVLAGLAVDWSMSDRERAVKLLQAQVGDGADVNARDDQLAQPFTNRALLPLVGAAGSIAARVTPVDAHERTARKLALAGNPAGWDAERVLAFKVIGVLAGLIGGLVIGAVVGFGGLASIAVIVLFGFIGFVLPDAILDGKVRDRQREIRNALSDTLDLLTISVEAGLSLNAALSRVVQNTPGTLSAEFARMLQEIQLGVSRADAFRNLAERTDVEELNAFTLAMIQADVFGVSIGSVLRTQAQQLRIKRRQRAERAAQQTPVKIVFPLILCILPALFIVIVGPGVIRIMESLFG
jgi:tight adherence protein C